MLKSLRAIMASFALLSTASQGQTPTPTFCERLAPQLKMRFWTASTGDRLSAWRIDTASLGMVLFGGSTATRIGLEPIDDTSLAEYKRVDKDCEITRKGAACHVHGPARLHIQTKKMDASVDASAGETAEVQVNNTVVLCRDTLPQGS